MLYLILQCMGNVTIQQKQANFRGLLSWNLSKIKINFCTVDYILNFSQLSKIHSDGFLDLHLQYDEVLIIHVSFTFVISWHYLTSRSAGQFTFMIVRNGASSIRQLRSVPFLWSQWQKINFRGQFIIKNSSIFCWEYHAAGTRQMLFL
jgi:hypothetical protein